MRGRTHSALVATFTAGVAFVAAPLTATATNELAAERGTEPAAEPGTEPAFTIEAFPVPSGSRPHDVSPADDGGVWFTAQGSGHLGLLDPATGESTMIPLGDGSRPHGVITADDGAAWITDGGRNSNIRVDADTHAIDEYPLPAEAADANLNTAAFDGDGTLWFTGQAGWFGSVEPDGTVGAWPAPGGRGPYGIDATPDGDVYLVSLAGGYLGHVAGPGELTLIEPPVAGAGPRRVWSDSTGVLWISGWNSGDVYAYDPATTEWRTWPLPGEAAAYAVYVDDTDAVWLSDFAANAMVRFDPATETFTSVPLPSPDGAVRQIHGRPGEVWGAESSADQLIVVRPVTANAND